MPDTDAKYLVFTIGDERYGISITKVREVIRHEKITTVHEATSYLKGVINLRGKIIPIIDMRGKFGMPPREYDDRTVFIIVDVTDGGRDNFNFGMAVDAVQDVTSIPDTAIEHTPDVGLKLKSGYLYGIAKTDDFMLMVLNIDRILSTDEVLDIQSAEKAVTA